GHGRAGGQHVVHHHHVTPGNIRPGRKGAPDIGPPLGRPEVTLGLGVTQPREPAGPDGHAEAGGQALRQQRGLVEAPLALARPTQGDRDQGRHVTGQSGPLLADQGRQRTSQRPLAPKLERVDGVADDTLVLGSGPRPVPVRRLDPARTAEHRVGRRGSYGESTRSWPGQAAAVTTRRRDARDAIPARAAERIASPLGERGRADGTERREDEIEGGGRPGAERAAQRPWDGRNVFQRWHCGQRSCQVGAVAEQTPQRWGQSKVWPSRSARRYSSNAARDSPRRSNTAPRNACTTGMSGARISSFSNCSVASSSISSSKYTRPSAAASARSSGARDA